MSLCANQPQPTDLPTDVLLPDLRNLGLVLNDLEHSDRWKKLMDLVRRFLPRFSHLSTRIQAGHVQLSVHEEGLRAPIPATRLSDGNRWNDLHYSRAIKLAAKERKERSYVR